ncbi:MAG: T9SS type A sorting domain-containing protein [Bacteroidota bacterium]
MKTYKTYILTACLLLIAFTLYAGTDWNVTKNMFKYQKDVDESMDADYTRNTATVCYHDTLFNFVNYRVSGNFSSIIVRKITHSGTQPNLTFNYKKYDDISTLSRLEGEEWQPAPVVFHDSLILFYTANIYEDQYANGTTRFSVYNPLNNSWSGGDYVRGNYYGGITSHGMAAVVLDDKLCLVTHDNSDHINIHWTKDLKTWYHFTALESINSSSGEDDAISAVSAPYWDQNSKRKSKLVFAYRDGSKHPYAAEYYFSDDLTLTHLRTTAITTDDTYSSVALAVGTIGPDATSTGDCIQAFLKKDVTDNSHIYHRILRFQLKNNIWTRIEENVLPQNSPKHMWASREIPLTVAILPIPDGQDVRQYMCLVYRGYDNWDYPMNVAWSETNRMKYNAAKTASSEQGVTACLAGPRYTQYIGYVEGPPPFALNHYQPVTHPEDTIGDPYVNPNAEDVSELEFSSMNTTTSDMEIGYDVGTECKFKAGFLSAELSTAFGQVWGTEIKKTIKHAVQIIAQEENTGYYITLRPVVYRAFYDVYDVNTHWMDSTFYFYMTDPKFILEPVELQSGLASDDPATFYMRSGVNFASFSTTSYGNVDNSWVQGTKVSNEIEVEQAERKKNKVTAKLKLGAELGHIFDIGFEGSFEYTMTTTTSTGNTIKSATRLNVPEYPKDIVALAYDTYWLKPNRSAGINNWWLHEGALDQETWCVTYDVTYIKHKDGTTIGHNKGMSGQENDPVETELGQNPSADPDSLPVVTKPEQVLPSGFSLSQNYPNPCRQTTKIRYQIGTDITLAHPNGYMTRLSVFNLSGTEVATLVNENKAPGSYEVEWDASQFTPGVYFYRLQSGSFKDVKKLVLLK